MPLAIKTLPKGVLGSPCSSKENQLKLKRIAGYSNRTKNRSDTQELF
jgi:hypothetical protein